MHLFGHARISHNITDCKNKVVMTNYHVTLCTATLQMSRCLLMHLGLPSERG